MCTNSNNHAERLLRMWHTFSLADEEDSPLSWPMADWFMEECIRLSDWTLGGLGGI